MVNTPIREQLHFINQTVSEKEKIHTYGVCVLQIYVYRYGLIIELTFFVYYAGNNWEYLTLFYDQLHNSHMCSTRTHKRLNHVYVVLQLIIFGSITLTILVSPQNKFGRTRFMTCTTLQLACISAASRT